MIAALSEPLGGTVVGALGGKVAAAVTVLAALTAAGQSSDGDGDLADTVWVGQCAGLQVGTYTLAFGAQTVLISFPDGRSPRSVPYSVTGGPDDGALTVATAPPWHGSFTADRRILDWVVQVGDTSRYGRCHLVRQQ